MNTEPEPFRNAFETAPEFALNPTPDAAPAELPPTPVPVAAVPAVPGRTAPVLKPQRGIGWQLLLVVLALAAGTLLGGWGRRPAWWGGGASELAGSFATAERKVAPSVVKIEVESPHVPIRGGFALPGMPIAPARHNDHSLGSGLVLTPDGYIVTNGHVVSDATRVEVTVFGDDHTYIGRVVGVDTETDLAVIKITPPHPMPVAKLGDSNRLQVGDWVVAIGSPFGLDNSVTAGIVSALQRPGDNGRQFESFIQTDAAINPGNSGGPLINLAGEVVGINTAIFTEDDGYQGVAFALPSQLVKNVAPQLMRQGHVTRGSIGVYFEATIDPAVRRIYHLESGVALSQISAGGPAAKAGLQPGDVITSLNGTAVADGNALMNQIIFFPVGKAVRVGYMRNGAARMTAVTVADRDRLFPVADAPVTAPASPDAVAAAPRTPLFGLDLKDATPAGAEVVGLVPDTFADRIQLHRDDVVVELNRQPVANSAALRLLAAKIHDGDDVAMVLRRPNGDGTSSRWLLGGTFHP